MAGQTFILSLPDISSRHLSQWRAESQHVRPARLYSEILSRFCDVKKRFLPLDLGLKKVLDVCIPDRGLLSGPTAISSSPSPSSILFRLCKHLPAAVAKPPPGPLPLPLPPSMIELIQDSSRNEVRTVVRAR